ncbi:MAG: PAS domain S-box protein [Proteobacteria bacterium]|nr:PAS domain S-box protein [Pseudomonadota bacterium]
MIEDLNTAFAQLVRCSPMGIHFYELEPSGRLVFVGANPAADRLLGVDNSQFIGKAIEEAFPPLAATEIPARYRTAAAEGVAWSTEQIDYDDETIRGAFEVHAFQTGSGRMAVLFADITQRLCDRRALEESERRYRDLFENASDMIQIDDRHGRVVYVNAAWRRRLGYAEAEVAPLTLAELVHPNSIAAWESVRRRALTGENVERFEAVLQTKEAEGVFVEGSVNARIESGAPLWVRYILRDVTERREVDRVKDEFISLVSHELRTPLTSIRGALGLMAGGVVGALPEKTLTMVEIACRNADRLIRLINTILDLEKLEAGKIVLYTERLRPPELLQPVVDMLAVVAADAGVALVVEEVEPTPCIEGDRDRLIQVLTNLVGNAIKFSSTGETVRLRCRAAEDAVVFEVEDHGPGIPAGAEPKLFRRFQQLDGSATRARGGTGLGLAISRAIVEQHGGSIGVQNAPQQGARFFFRLPRARS